MKRSELSSKCLGQCVKWGAWVTNKIILQSSDFRKGNELRFNRTAQVWDPKQDFFYVLRARPGKRKSVSGRLHFLTGEGKATCCARSRGWFWDQMETRMWNCFVNAKGPFSCKLLQLFSSSWVVWGQQQKSPYFVFTPTLWCRGGDPRPHPSSFPAARWRAPHRHWGFRPRISGGVSSPPTISATGIPLDRDKQIKLHPQDALLGKLHLNLETYVFQLKTDLEANKKLP